MICFHLAKSCLLEFENFQKARDDFITLIGHIASNIPFRFSVTHKDLEQYGRAFWHFKLENNHINDATLNWQVLRCHTLDT